MNIGEWDTGPSSKPGNLAPYSYFNLMGSDPPYVAFGSTGVKDSLQNLREVPEFVANTVTMHLLERMNFTSGDFPRDEDEFAWAHLTPAPSATPRPSRWVRSSSEAPIPVTNVETAVVPYGHAPYDGQNLLQVRRPRLGGSNERLDRDRSRRRHHLYVGDYGRQRGILRPGKHTQLLQYPHDD